MYLTKKGRIIDPQEPCCCCFISLCSDDNLRDDLFFQLLDKLASIWRHAIEEPSLAFGEKNIERERRFARAAEPGDNYHLVPWNTHVDVLEIVFAGAVNLNGPISGQGDTSGERTPLAYSVRCFAKRLFCCPKRR